METDNNVTTTGGEPPSTGEGGGSTIPNKDVSSFYRKVSWTCNGLMFLYGTAYWMQKGVFPVRSGIGTTPPIAMWEGWGGGRSVKDMMIDIWY